MSTSVRRCCAVLAGALLAMLVVVPALAHAELVSSTPEDGAVLATPPVSVELRFSEGLLGAKSSFRLVGPDGEVGTGRLTRDGGKVMAIDGLALAPGEYTVKWTIGSADGHVERGTLRFTISEPTPEPATSSPAPTTAPSEVATASPTIAPATDAPATPPATAAPSNAAAAVSPATSPQGVDGSPAAASGTDVLIPIVGGLVLVAGVGVFVLRRSRGA